MLNLVRVLLRRGVDLPHALPLGGSSLALLQVVNVDRRAVSENLANGLEHLVTADATAFSRQDSPGLVCGAPKDDVEVLRLSPSANNRVRVDILDFLGEGAGKVVW